MHIRDCTADDVPWILRQARAAYIGLVEQWHDDGATAWVAACVAAPDMITVRGDGVVGFGGLVAYPWAPTVRECDLVHLFGSATDPGGTEALQVVRSVWERAQSLGCRKMYIGSIFADLTVIGRRLGGKPFAPVYVLENRDVQ